MKVCCLVTVYGKVFEMDISQDRGVGYFYTVSLWQYCHCLMNGPGWYCQRLFSLKFWLPVLHDHWIGDSLLMSFQCKWYQYWCILGIWYWIWFKWIWAGCADIPGNSDDLPKAVAEKLERRYSSNFGTFSTVDVNGILLGCGGMVDLVHGGMVGAVDSKICSMVDIFVVGIGYGNGAGKMLRPTQPVLLKYMQVTLSQKYNGFVVQLLIVQHIGNHPWQKSGASYGCNLFLTWY